MKRTVTINKNDGCIVIPTGRKAYHSYTKYVSCVELGGTDVPMREAYIEVSYDNDTYRFIKQSDCIELDIE